ncbi:MAG TPA: tRNA uridine-5-carboxymethylaminomethyl(34) synthesis enzyme MnmG, partial [Cyclobacteriaceae bacterium]
STSTLSEKITAAHLLKRPQIGIKELKQIDNRISEQLNRYSSDVLDQAEIFIKYESYIDREEKLATKIEGLENYKIKSDFDYDRVKALSSEAREKLKKIKPETIGQMSRISGVSPADVSVLTVYLGK